MEIVNRGISKLLFPPCIGEILVKPPIQLAAVQRAVAIEAVQPNLPPISLFGPGNGVMQQSIGQLRSRTPARARGRNSFHGPRAPDQPLRHPAISRNGSTGQFMGSNSEIAARGDFATESAILEGSENTPPQDSSSNNTVNTARRPRTRSLKPSTPHAVKSVPQVNFT